MKVVPGSHLHGVMKHKRSQQTDSILSLELETGTFTQADAIQFKLKAGEISLHDDRCVHSSPSNPSHRRRAGLTIRYSGTNVKNDLSINPNFKAYLCRGVDEYHLNPVGIRPTKRFARPSFKAVSIEEADVVPNSFVVLNRELSICELCDANGCVTRTFLSFPNCRVAFATTARLPYDQFGAEHDLRGIRYRIVSKSSEQ